MIVSTSVRPDRVSLPYTHAHRERRALLLVGEPGVGNTVVWRGGIARAIARGHHVLEASWIRCWT
jgi:hypothetical protein